MNGVSTSVGFENRTNTSYVKRILHRCYIAALSTKRRSFDVE